MPIASLDYEGAKLNMHADSPIEAQWRVHACHKEPWTLAFIESIPAPAVFWDIGANTGPYSLIAASRGLFPVCVEPGFANFHNLCSNLTINNFLDKSIQLQLALGEVEKYEWFHYRDLRAGAASHILGGARKLTHHKQLIRLRTWDALFAELPLSPTVAQFAKIDADGGELSILKGASQTLARLSGLMVELSNEQEAETVALLAAAGLLLAERFDKRDGKPLGAIAYGRFAREV